MGEGPGPHYDENVAKEHSGEDTNCGDKSSIRVCYTKPKLYCQSNGSAVRSLTINPVKREKLKLFFQSLIFNIVLDVHNILIFNKSFFNKKLLKSNWL